MKLAFRTTWPLRKTTVFERLFHPNLALSLRDKRELLGLKSALAVWMYNPISGALIGETYATSARDAYEDEDEGQADIKPYLSRRAALGKILKAHFLGRLAQVGYEVAIGHARLCGGSVALNRTFGARFGQRHRNWSGTGEEYRFYELRLP